MTGKNLGQKKPDLKPELFGPNIISVGMAEINAAFAPDYKEFYYSIRMSNGQLVIMELKRDKGKWSEPEVALFSGKYDDADPFITYDGNWFYYISKRPIDTSNIAEKDWDIWRMRNNGYRWGEPERLGSEINTNKDIVYPTMTLSGRLYFSSARYGGNNSDIYYADMQGESFGEPTKLGDSINGYWEGDTFISPEEDYLIFTSYGREEGPGLYVSFNKNGQWSLPKRMGMEINMTGREFCPIVSPDGKYFFFTSNQSVLKTESSERITHKKIKEDFIKSYNHPQMGKTDIYWVDSKIIDNYKNH